MKRRLGTIAVLAAIVAALLGAGAPSASAATEYGSHCEPFGSTEGEWASLERLAAFPGGTLETGGVITRWRLNLEHLLFLDDPIERLKTYRGSGVSVEVSGESTPAPTSTAANGVATRIPVRKGDFVGLQSEGDEGRSIYCEGQGTESVVALAAGNPSVGEEVDLVMSLPEAALPVRVRIEADADGDGYGDESQDACPTDASTHGPCPLVPAPLPPPPPSSPHPSGRAIAHKGSVTVKATTDVAGPVTVTGSVKLGNGKNAKLNGGTQTLAAGKQGSFTLKFTKKLKAKLATLPAEQKLKLAITISAANSVGTAGTRSLSLKLPGQAGAK